MRALLGRKNALVFCLDKLDAVKQRAAVRSGRGRLALARAPGRVTSVLVANGATRDTEVAHEGHVSWDAGSGCPLAKASIG